MLNWKKWGTIRMRIDRNQKNMNINCVDMISMIQIDLIDVTRVETKSSTSIIKYQMTSNNGILSNNNISFDFVDNISTMVVCFISLIFSLSTCHLNHFNGNRMMRCERKKTFIQIINQYLFEHNQNWIQRREYNKLNQFNLIYFLFILKFHFHWISFCWFIHFILIFFNEVF